MKYKHNHILFTEVLAEDKKFVIKKFPTSVIYSEALNNKALIKAAKDKEIICISIRTHLNAKIISSLPKLKLIVTRSVGYDHIDLKRAKQQGIIVCNVPDYGSHVISEFVFALLLSGLRHIGKGDARVEKDYKFSFTDLRGGALKGKTIGIIGTGKIGANVSRIASLGFLMKVIAHDVLPNKELAEINHFKYTSLTNIFKKADIISLHCPLLPTTKHLINQKSLSLMKKGVIIVNTSRGGLINSKALTKAIKSSRVSYAFLDVLEHEDNIKQDKELIKLPQVIVTPHIAFYADDSMHKMYVNSFAIINNFLHKKPLSTIVTGI